MAASSATSFSHTSRCLTATSRQRQGIGSALVRHGLGEARRLGHAIVVVLGHPDYYPRFGFVPGRSHGIECPFDAPEDAFMVLGLDEGALDRARGRVEYPPQFLTVSPTEGTRQ